MWKLAAPVAPPLAALLLASACGNGKELNKPPRDSNGKSW
jgi:hypothetical protein